MDNKDYINEYEQKMKQEPFWNNKNKGNYSLYKKICKEHNCKAKVFTQMSDNLSTKIGSPDLIILFKNTVSHKMVKTAVDEAKKNNVQVVRCHTSSGSALENILKEYVA